MGKARQNRSGRDVRILKSIRSQHRMTELKGGALERVFKINATMTPFTFNEKLKDGRGMLADLLTNGVEYMRRCALRFWWSFGGRVGGKYTLCLNEVSSPLEEGFAKDS